MGGMLIAQAAGQILEWTGDYRLLFATASSAYVIGLLIIHVLNPRLKPMELSA
jgi:ACS family hexuronate transporter-like MFS transporter